MALAAVAFYFAVLSVYRVSGQQTLDPLRVSLVSVEPSPAIEGSNMSVKVRLNRLLTDGDGGAKEERAKLDAMGQGKRLKRVHALKAGF